MTATHKANNAILNKYFHEVPYPYGTWIGLSTTLIDDYGNGAVEPSTSSGYTRYSGSSITWDFASTEGSAKNTTIITFPKCTKAWGIIVELFIASASIEGDILYHTKLNPTIPTYIGTQISINPYTLLVTERT